LNKQAASMPMVGVAAAALYTAIMGAGMWFMHDVKGVTYGAIAMFDTFWVVMIVVNLGNFAFLLRYFGWREAGFGKLRGRQLVWFAPFIALLLYKWSIHAAAFVAKPPDAAQWRQFVFVGAVTFLVGLGEEVAFRGLLLRGVLTMKTPLRAMLISSIGFALLHSVNVFGGEPPGMVAFQLFYTFLWGFMYAPLALRLNSLWPLILGHWLFDFAQFTTLMTGKLEALRFDLALYPLEIALGALLWFLAWRDREGASPGRPGLDWGP